MDNKPVQKSGVVLSERLDRYEKLCQRVGNLKNKSQVNNIELMLFLDNP